MSKTAALVETSAHASRDLLTVKQVAERLGVHPDTVRDLALRGEIRFVRVGRQIRFRELWVEEFIERQGRKR
jgi:excisionase family DNA binding protein